MQKKVSAPLKGRRVVVRDGMVQTADIEAIRAKARKEAVRLWERMRAL
ncbi:MAG: hypothetical protein ACE5JI_04395 [Acidobacteriota bacterium]